MKLKFKFFQKENIIIKLLLLSSFSITWLSISSDLNDLSFQINYLDKNLIYNLINFLRTSLNILCFILLLFYFFVFLIKKKLTNFNNIYLFFTIYLLLQIPGLVFITGKFENIYLLISSFNIILILYFSEKFFKYDEMKYFIYISIFIISILLFIVFYNNSIEYFSGERTLFYGNPLTILDKSAIRSSGSGRLSLIILIFLMFYFINEIKEKLSTNFLISFLSMIIIIYQSRANIALLMMVVLIYTIYKKDFSFNNLLKIFLIFFLIPVLMTTLFPIIKTYLIYISENQNHIFHNLISEFSSHERTKCQDGETCIKNLIRNMPFNSSGRFDDWIAILKNFDFNENLFFGYGSQGDRYLINQTASNSLIYSFTSSGLIGLFFFTAFLISTLIYIFKYFFYHNLKDKISMISFTIILVLSFRSIIESSFAVFGVVQILFFISIVILKKKLHQ